MINNDPALTYETEEIEEFVEEDVVLEIPFIKEEFLCYEKMSDEQVAECARNNDGKASEYILNKYKNFVRSKARSYFLIGADREDIIQEGMIGLYKAVRGLPYGKADQLQGICGALHYAPDHYSHKDRDAPEAPSFEFLYFTQQAGI